MGTGTRQRLTTQRKTLYPTGSGFFFFLLGRRYASMKRNTTTKENN